ncbi:hypothetical protein B2J88_07675 [Rhodococcus sp. SRB_17]|nr:hypothetical protein [Rhodococcus sp. SRB_17]
MDSIPGGPATAGMGIHVVDHRRGHATVTMKVTEFMLNGFGHCHGGFVFMVADTAFGMACNSDGEPNAVGADTSMNFIRPVTLGTTLTATGTRGTTFGRNMLCHTVITDSSGSVVAELNGRCVQVRPK